MRAEIRDLGGARSTQPPTPELRVAEEGVGAVERLREMALNVKEMPAEIEAARKIRRQRLLEWRPDRFIGGAVHFKRIVLVVEWRHDDGVLPIDQHGFAAMRRGDDRFNRKVRREAFQRVDEKSPGAVRVGAEVGPDRVWRERSIGPGGLRQDLALAIQDDDFQVGLADVEDGGAAGHASAHSRQSPSVAGPPSGLARVRACIGSSLFRPARRSAPGGAGRRRNS